MSDESPSILPVSAFLSPSLERRASSAFEFKYLVDPVLADAVQDWARQHMHPDPHGDPDRNGAYQTTTLYCDTPALDVFHKSRTYKRRKFRLRRYGFGQHVFLERKTKNGQQVRKKRSIVSLGDLSILENAVSTPDWDGHWFHRRLLIKGLGPVCALSYERTAFGKPTDSGGCRLTLDRHLQSQVVRGWHFPEPGTGLPVLADHVIVELKFQDSLPSLFKQLLVEFHLPPSSHSKYRSTMQAWGITATSLEKAHA